MGRIGIAIALCGCLLASCQEPTQVEESHQMQVERPDRVQQGRSYQTENYQGNVVPVGEVGINEAGLHPESGLISSHVDLLGGKLWSLVEAYDPYDGGKWYRPGSTDPQHLFFFNTGGGFTEDYTPGGHRQIGTWALSGGDQSLLLHYTDQSNRDLGYEVRRLTFDTLQIAWQGRHGMVVETYVGTIIKK